MKYPKNNALIHMPYEQENGLYKCAEVNPDGKFGKVVGFAEHQNFESCWICCRAYNIRVGYSDKKVSKILKYLENGKKEKKQKKAKKSKKSKTRNKAKNSKKKGRN